MRDVIEIRTERLRLRRPAHEDARAIARFTSDPAVARMVARIPLPNPQVAVEGWLMILRARARLAADHVFAIDADGEGLVGVIGAHGGLAWSDAAQAVEVGYWIGRPFWGRGYASEALIAFVGEARTLGTLEAGHFVDNPASGRVLEKAGFVYTGAATDLFSLGRVERVACKRMRFEPDLWARTQQSRSAAEAASIAADGLSG